MKLYLTQHGRAVDGSVNPQRPLSAQGKLEVVTAAHYFKALGVNIKYIFHNGKSHAAQTAEVFAHTLDSNHPNRLADTRSDDVADSMAKAINAWKDDTMIVGHLSFISGMLLRLAGSSLGSDELPGDIVWLDKISDRRWSLVGSYAYSDADNMARRRLFLV